jgi:molybdate transport system permease protein
VCLTFAFSWRGAVLAAAVMSFPLMVRAIRLALEGVDLKLEQAAVDGRRKALSKRQK